MTSAQSEQRVLGGLAASFGILVGAAAIYGRVFNHDDGESASNAAVVRAGAAAVAPGFDAANRSAVVDATAARLGVTAVDGMAERHRGATRTPLAVGNLIEGADVVSTGNGASVELRNDVVGVVVNVAPASRLRLDGLGPTDTRLTLERGRVRATSGRAREISLGAAGSDARARVEDGSVSMQAEPGGAVQVVSHDRPVTLYARDETLQVAPGDRAVVLPGKAPRRVPLPRALLLRVRWPSLREQRERVVHVAGVTGPGALVRSAGSSTYADSDGRFSLLVPLHDGANRPRVVTEDLAGRRREAQATDPILVDRRRPPIQVENVRYGP